MKKPVTCDFLHRVAGLPKVATFASTYAEYMNSFTDDELIDALEAELPASNCGACGLPGCRSFAEIVAGSGGTGSLFCSVGGTEVMHRIHSLLAGRQA